MDKTLAQECEEYNERVRREAARTKAKAVIAKKIEAISPERSNYKDPSYQSYLDTHGLNSRSNGGY
jgi:hypothetical protein